jgi:HEPN domain-containing protein
MPHDPARVADTKAWLSRAATDLRAAALDLAADPPVLDDLVFHCQQAVETAMKSLLTWHDEPFGKTHNLETLVDQAVPLTEYAWKFRYPGEHEGASRDEAERALMIAREVFEAVLARVPQDTHP